MIAPGTTLLNYRVVEKVGEGGMGAVWKATDSTLDRDVAIKVLPEPLAADPERIARFEREAKVLASLNHPNVAAIYGFHECDGVRFLAMELVPGEGLDQRISRGPLPVDEAVQVASKIADALEYSHERGIVHRDLKPANIRIAADGTVKVLDFGLAKAIAGDPASSGSTSTPTILPTVTSAGTAVGMILGTAAYMSPEQARGKIVDKRADIWAFGVVLFEMLTAQRLFEGETVSDTIAAVLTRPVDLDSLPKSVPASLRRLLQRCLDRDPKTRLRDIGDAHFDLSEAEHGSEAALVAAMPKQGSRWLVVGLAGVAAAAIAVAAWLAFSVEPPARPTYVSIALPTGLGLESGPAISRDGRRVAFVASDGLARPLLYVRELSDAESRPLPGTEDADGPFFSPDGQWIAYYAGDGLFKVRADGGSPIRIAPSTSHNGGTWTDDGTIVFKRTWNGGLGVVGENGGEVKSLLELASADEYAYVWPYALPGRHELLFASWGKTFQTVLLDTSTMKQRVVAPGWWRRVAYVASGYLLGAYGGELRVLKLAGPGEAPGEAVTVVKEVDTGGMNGASPFAVSQNGTLAYVRGRPADRRLAILDRRGQATRLPIAAGAYAVVRLSPDGRRAAVRNGGGIDIVDLERGTVAPIAPEQDRGAQGNPVWSLDGRFVTFASNRQGNWDIYRKSATGAGEMVPVLEQPLDQYPDSYAPDGTLLFNATAPQTGIDLWMLPPHGEPRPWLATGSNEFDGRFSPDGRLVAYVSNASGRDEVYVQPRDNPEDRTQVSVAGGGSPVWSPRGDRLIFRQGILLMEVTLKTAGGVSASAPVRVFDPGWTMGDYDVLPDGERFLAVELSRDEVPTRIDLVLNWTTLLEESRERR